MKTLYNSKNNNRANTKISQGHTINTTEYKNITTTKLEHIQNIRQWYTIDKMNTEITYTRIPQRHTINKYA